MMDQADREAILNRHLASFLQVLSQEVGEPALGALIVVSWPMDVSTGFCTPVLKRQATLNVLQTMFSRLTKSVDKLRAQINLRRDEVQ